MEAGTSSCVAIDAKRGCHSVYVLKKSSMATFSSMASAGARSYVFSIGSNGFDDLPNPRELDSLFDFLFLAWRRVGLRVVMLVLVCCIYAHACCVQRSEKIMDIILPFVVY